MKNKKGAKKYNSSAHKKYKNSNKPASIFREVLIEEISLRQKSKVIVKGIVNKIAQTGGPTIFVVSDGTGSMSIKGFLKPGERSYPEIEEGDFVKATIAIGEFHGDIEGEISRMDKLDEQQKEIFIKDMEKIQFDKAKVEPPKFLVQDIILEKLKERFVQAATQIRLAIFQDRPIIIRHHNDADGYSSGFALERAILPLIQNYHGSRKSAWEYYSRAPCQAPFYEVDDSIRDTANSLRNVAKFSNKMPLIIIADNGSSPEDLMAIKQGKIHGADFIVVDHHGFDKDVISAEVLTHINPFLVAEDGSSFSAGMLCAELARFVNPKVENILQIPAMAGFADKIELMNPETMNAYLRIAENEGYSKELLSDIALVIDYVSAKVRFMEVREYIEVLFGQPREKQRQLVNLMAPYIRELDRKGLAIGKVGAEHDKLGNTIFQFIAIEESFPGFGFFPKPGRSVSLIHDDFLKEKGDIGLVTAGIMNTAITLRATDKANFSVHELLNLLNEKLPNAFVNGGGHKNAGSINFIPSKKREVVKLLRDFIRNR
ncbi:MAG: hypothetical protein U9Q99_03185 [Nanoarchaeota archaeon]|nr:hypothetical protein [Nanoarchaeota archaeon]